MCCFSFPSIAYSKTNRSVWKFLLDTENMYDFMYRNTNEEQRKDLVYGELLMMICCYSGDVW